MTATTYTLVNNITGHADNEDFQIGSYQWTGPAENGFLGAH
ncbi:hypothetical protein [Saccharophagus sp. K07]|nr:hypothetical protein [Saccharophagus sp. K07]